MTSTPAPVIRLLGQVAYEPTWRAMQQFTDERDEATPDEIWFLQHPPVFTQGMNGRATHLLATEDIPVVAVDRGGQVTYHGPGQWVVYPLLDLRRLNIGIRTLVTRLEQAVIQVLSGYDIAAEARTDAPGVYVNDAKIAALGLRVRRGCCYHGLAFNVDMDLEPFARINPCGFAGLRVTQLSDLAGPVDLERVRTQLEAALRVQLYAPGPDGKPEVA
ncbi:MAG: lipoyl(octanoyl) transferase LipB [Pseudomonadota bacterium]|nr:lipoyl(octanoyl) transferase LipB [Pseudomonadota bacterium]